MEENKTEKKVARNISSFTNAVIDTNKIATRRYGTYTERTVETHKTITSKSNAEKQKLSREQFEEDGFYKRLIVYYATLLKYQGILIPNPSFGQDLSQSHIQKKYFKALDLIDKLRIPSLSVNCALRALIDGCYYGIIIILEDSRVVVLDLPAAYCRTRLKDFEGNDIIEFNLAYFNTIIDKTERKQYLSVYPKEIKKAYENWRDGKRKSRWYMISTSITLCIPFLFEGQPFFLSVLEDIEKYKDAVDNDIERDLEEIRKIVIQKIPHLNDGRLVFEPDEAAEMHKGAVGMLRSNPNISVLTSYADVDSIVSKTTADNQRSNIDKMLQTIYSESGTSSQIFSSTGSSTLETSIKNDVALMMILANKIGLFVTNLINRLYSNSNINFKFTMLPITWYNEEKYIDSSLKLASSGYSLIIPALALGLGQRDLINIKDLENKVLDLKSKLIPPQTSYTQGTGKVGAPKKSEEDKSPKTLANERSLDNQTQGGSD